MSRPRGAEREALVRDSVADHQRRSGEWVRGNCAFCPLVVGKRDVGRSFGLNERTGFYHCFRCATAGFLEGASVDRDGPWSDAPVRVRAGEMALPAGFLPLASGRGAEDPEFRAHRNFLRRRGVRRGRWGDLRVGVVEAERGSEEARWRGRVLLPIVSAEGGVLGWVGRAVFKAATLKYLYPPGMPRGSMLFNHAALLAETDEPAIVAEGVFDALAFGADGVAALGLGGGGGGRPPAGATELQARAIARERAKGTFTDWQVEALAASRRPLAIVLDGDAHEEAWAISRRLRALGARAGSVRLEPGQDPDEADVELVRERARASLSE